MDGTCGAIHFLCPLQQGLLPCSWIKAHSHHCIIEHYHRPFDECWMLMHERHCACSAVDFGLLLRRQSTPRGAVFIQQRLQRNLFQPGLQRIPVNRLLAVVVELKRYFVLAQPILCFLDGIAVGNAINSNHL